MKRIVFFMFLLVLAPLVISCEFSEEIVFDEAGGGILSMEVNMDQMMSIMQSMDESNQPEKVDTVIYVKDVLEEKRDSIAKLPLQEQKKLKAFEAFSVLVHMDSEKGKMHYKLKVPFKSVEEIKDLSETLDLLNDVPLTSSQTSEMEPPKGISSVGVDYSFADKIFVRKAYIKDVEQHQRELDSLKPMEQFYSSSVYRIKYTFPQAIKSVGNVNGKISKDKKSVWIELPLLTYLQNPEELNLLVKLE